jgi:transposase-like protein
MSKKTEKRTQYTKEQRAAHVEAFTASGKTVAEYARSVGLNEGTLHNWLTGRGQLGRPVNQNSKNLRVEAHLLHIKKLLSNHPHLPTLAAILLVGIVSTGVNVTYAIANIVAWLRG